VSQLQRESEAALALEAESASINQQLALQVAALQRGFSSLADAVLEELEAVRDESMRWPEERTSWVNAMERLRDDMDTKLQRMEARHDEGQAALDKAWGENQQLRAENDVLHARLSELEARNNELTRHVDQVRRGVSALQESGTDVKESLSGLAAKVEAREAIQRTIGRTLADLEARLSDEMSRLRDDATNTCRALQTDAEAAAGDLEGLRTWCKQLDGSHRTMVADVQARLAHLEAGPDLGPVLSAVQALEDRVGNLSRQHEASVSRVEAGLGRINADAAESSARLGQFDQHLQAVRRALREHHEALVRSAGVFAGALNMSSPVSEVSLQASLNPGADAKASAVTYQVPSYGAMQRPHSAAGTYHMPLSSASRGAHPSSVSRGAPPSVGRASPSVGY